MRLPYWRRSEEFHPKLESVLIIKFTRLVVMNSSDTKLGHELKAGKKYSEKNGTGECNDRNTECPH